MKPRLFYQEGVIEIWLGDARETGLPDGFAGLIVTDPPYNKGKDYGIWNDKMDLETYRKFCGDWLKEAKRLIEVNGSIYFSCASSDLFFYKELLSDIEINLFQILIWYRPNLFGRRIPGNRCWGFQYEPVLWCGKGKKPVLINIAPGLKNSDVIVAPSPQSNWKKELRVHVTQKPKLLYRTIIAKTPGEPIVDLFLGSGTSLVIAKELGRRAIGFDINEEYCELAARRIEEIRMKETQGLFNLNGIQESHKERKEPKERE